MFPAGEVEAGELVHVGTHQHVGVGERVGRLQEEESDQPVRHEERGVGVELRRQVVGRVGHDHLRGSRGPRDGHRQVGGEPSVDEIATVAQLGVEQQWHGDAGANRLGQVAGAHDDRRPIRQIGGDGAERNGQRVEIPTGKQVAAEQGGVHQRVELRLDDRGALQIEAMLPLLPQDQRLQHAEAARGPRLIGAKQLGEWNHSSQGIQLAAGVPAGVERAHRGTHTRAHDQVRSDPEAVQHAEHADVGQPLGAPAREHQGGSRRRTALAGEK